jgi:hypothetical protein
LCQCKRCQDPTSLGTFGDAFLCKKCKFDPKTGKGAVIKAEPNKWKCNKVKTLYSIAVVLNVKGMVAHHDNL